MKAKNLNVGRGHVDSPAKKLVRLDVFETAQRILNGRFTEGTFLGLSSKEAGDYGTLTGLGVEPRNITMCDVDELAVADAKARWFPGITVLHDDILNVVKNKKYSGGAWLMINYDTCAPLRDDTPDNVLKLAMNVEENGILCCWFLAGRENGGTMEDIKAMEGLLRDCLTDKAIKSLKIPKDILDDRMPYIARALLLDNNINTKLAPHGCHTRLIRIWTYTSTDVVEGKIGSPMVVVMCQLRKGKSKSAKGLVEDQVTTAIQHSHFIVVGDCRKRLGQKAMEILNEGRPAGLLLNSRNSEAAWRAHATRGTYG